MYVYWKYPDRKSFDLQIIKLVGLDLLVDHNASISSINVPPFVPKLALMLFLNFKVFISLVFVIFFTLKGDECLQFVKGDLHKVLE